MGQNNKIDEGTTPGSIGEKLLSNVASNIEGIISVKPMAKYLSGARCILKVNGKIIGFAFAISWEIKTSVTEINTIDDYMPYELAPQRIEVNGAISGFRIPGSGPTQKLIQADLENFLHQRYIEIEVRDSQTDNLIFLTRRAMITSRTENVKIDQLADMTLSFRAIGWADERAPAPAPDLGKPVSTEASSTFADIKRKFPF
ncbi:hypothetical protein UFOVP53_218 [uncultured Caudovirales phage]|uniref:Uncharacterized protein n=1 Tax=uncultured Caudovirales phage TaxID=2100421 RepID=A0A6J5KUT0_9CAUD|nr:hypothetical protein UFOVP53_218 [uncultured Caudovirales phage]